MISAIKRLFSRKPIAARAFDAARMSRLLADWVTSSYAIDADIRAGLTVLRSRSRDLCANNGYGRRFLELLAGNVVGPQGIRLQSKVKRPDGKPDDNANQKIEAAWSAWCRPANCTVTRKLSFTDLLALGIKGLARDGEMIARTVSGFARNDFAFAVQLLDPEYLDHDYNDIANGIVMGVELDEWKGPVAYHILTNHPGRSEYPLQPAQKRQRVSAAEVLHVFVTERAEQTRGYPWTVAALKDLHQLGQYRYSEAVAARVSAAKMGFFTRNSEGAYPYDDKDSSGNLIDEVSPGKFQELPSGYEFKTFDPTHPNQAFGDFCKSALKGIASGLNISYISLANDLTETSYSSGRQGLLEERTFYMMLQGFLVEHLVQPIFEAWLPHAIASGKLALPMRDLERWNAPVWQSKRWSWIDPSKDIDAREREVRLGVNSRTRIAGDLGLDIDDVYTELHAEKEAAERLEIDVSGSIGKGKGCEDGTKNQNQAD
ncbi:MAG: phage portal protein [Desulfobacterales bacterium]|jgi:lambda family phage portal protein|nr:phage portal protein [Desulfobacterales bacterium]MCU0601297.1 phage portal protein [Desulfobacterales bacterium]